MTKRTTPSPRSGFLPPEIIAFIRRRLWQSLGLAISAIAIPFSVLLATYQPSDPSFNTATDRLPDNLLSFPGAMIADILLQLFGVASWALVPAIVVLGGHFLLEKSVHRVITRGVCLSLTVVIGAMIFALIPNHTHWLMSQGLGGTVGFLIQQNLVRLMSSTAYYALNIVAIISGFFIYSYVLGIPFRTWLNTVRLVSKVCTKFSVKKSLLEPAPFLSTTPEDHYPVFSSLSTSAGQHREEKGIYNSHNQDLLVKTPYEDQEKEYGAEGEGDESFDARETVSLVTRPIVEDSTLVAPLNLEEAVPFKNHSTRQPKVPLMVGGEEYHLPSPDLLDDASLKNAIKALPPELLQESARQLETVLQEFGVRGEIVAVYPGPVVTLYELKPAAGIKSSRVIGLADDIARSMSALSARIAVVPGRNVIGIELPNPLRETVFLRDLLLTEAYERAQANLPLILGKDIGGQPIIADMARMPHLLVAGTTGSGKSVAVNTMILSVLFRLSPDKCRFIMIDPKMLELSIYDGIPHLLTPVVTDPKKAVVALKWAVREMESRYRAMAKLGVRNIDGYNARIKQARASGELLMRRVQTGFDPDSGKPIFENQSLDVEPLPYIIIVVDEMADLMLVAGKEIEAAVQRLAQMARAAGLHLIMATQRPSVDVITGTIKANFPTRISFQVTSKIDSRTILGEQGAEQLLGQGDMLYMAGAGRVMRVHGPFVRDDEVERIVQFLKMQGEPSYVDSITEEEPEAGELGGEEGRGSDPLYQQAVELVRREGKASTSFVQRYLQIGYNRAARIIEQMEKDGLISPANHAGKREVLSA